LNRVNCRECKPQRSKVACSIVRSGHGFIPTFGQFALT
jgi:hypothetical protein